MISGVYHVSMNIGKRDEELIEYYLSGKTYAATGRILGITRERVRQILLKYGIPTREIYEDRLAEQQQKKEAERASTELVKSQRSKTIGERFLEKFVKEPNGCWRWTAATNKVSGYGSFSWGGAPGTPTASPTSSSTARASRERSSTTSATTAGA